MHSRHLFQFLLFTAIALTSVADGLAAERYIIPIWAQDLRGGSNQWVSRLVITNPATEPVTVNVGPVFPLVSDPCRNVCGSPELTFTLGGKESTTVAPPVDSLGRRMAAGAFEIQSSGPLAVDHVVFTFMGSPILQKVGTGRRWLGPGSDFALAEPPSEPWRMNVFLVNPNDAVLVVTLWTGAREENELRVAVPPRSTLAVPLPPPLCGGEPCGTLPVFPPRLTRVNFESTATFFASVSTVTDHWASTALPITAQ